MTGNIELLLQYKVQSISVLTSTATFYSVGEIV